MNSDSKLFRLLIHSPWFLLLFCIIPVLVIISFSAHIYIPLAGYKPLLVNNACFALVVAFRFLYALKRVSAPLRYPPNCGRPRRSEELDSTCEEARLALVGEGYYFDQLGGYAEKRDMGHIGTVLVYGGILLLLATGVLDSLRQFSGLSLERIPDETTILNFRRLLEKHEMAAGILGVINGYLGDRGLSLRQGTIVDATLISAPSSTKNKDGKRDPEMHQTKKGNQYYFGAKAHIGVDDESGLVHSVVVTAANVADVTQVDKLLHGEENVVCADAGYTGVEKREEHAGRHVIWQVAARRSTYKKHGKRSAIYTAIRKIEKAKAQVRAKVEHPFRVIKRQFGYTKVRFRGLAKNTAQMITLFALSNLWMVRRHLMASAG